MDKNQIISALTAEGYTNVQEATFEANQVMGSHTHDTPTVHIITEGELIIVEGDGDLEARPEKRFGKGERIEFPAGTVHNAIAGPKGLVMIIGFKTS